MVLAAIAVVAPPAMAAVAAKPLRAAAFTTRVPAAWRVVAFEDTTGAAVYRIRTPQTRFDDQGIPLPGGAAIFVAVFTPGQFASFYGTDPPRRPDDLFDTFTSPSDATEAISIFEPHHAALGRVPAMTRTFGFRWREAFQVETCLLYTSDAADEL